MALKNLLRLGPSEYDIDGKDSSCFWINSNGKIYIRKAYTNSVCGWKLSGEKLIDYWGKEWFHIIPADQVPIEDIIYS